MNNTKDEENLMETMSCDQFLSNSSFNLPSSEFIQIQITDPETCLCFSDSFIESSSPSMLTNCSQQIVPSYSVNLFKFQYLCFSS